MPSLGLHAQVLNAQVCMLTFPSALFRFFSLACGLSPRGLASAFASRENTRGSSRFPVLTIQLGASYRRLLGTY